MDAFLSAGQTALTATGPVGAVAGLGLDLLSGIGPKYRMDNHVQRFVQAMQAGDDHGAGTLIDQAFYHAYIQTGIPNAGDWRGILSAMYSGASVKWRQYIDGLLAGAPLQYQYVGLTAPAKESLGGVVPNANPQPPAGSLGQKIAAFLGLGSAATNAAAAGGSAAGSQIASGIVKGALIVGGVVLLIVLIRHHK